MMGVPATEPPDHRLRSIVTGERRGDRTWATGKLGRAICYAHFPRLLVTAIVNFGIGANLVFSTWDWNRMLPENQGREELKHCLEMLADPVFWQAVRDTLVFSGHHRIRRDDPRLRIGPRGSATR